MFYTVNIDTHSAHTVIAGSKTEKAILSKPDTKMIIVGGYFHKIFKSATEAKTYLDMLMLHGCQS